MTSPTAEERGPSSSEGGLVARSQQQPRRCTDKADGAHLGEYTGSQGETNEVGAVSS